MLKCSVCGTKNRDDEGYCKKCGAWLIDHGIVIPRRRVRISHIFSVLALSVLIIAALAAPKSSELEDNHKNTSYQSAGDNTSPVSNSMPQSNLSDQPKAQVEATAFKIIDYDSSMKNNVLKVYGQVQNPNDFDALNVSITLIVYDRNNDPITSTTSDLPDIGAGKISPFFISATVVQPRNIGKYQLKTQGQYLK